MCISAWLNLSALFENNPSAWMFWIIVLLTDWADRCFGVSFSENTATIALISFGSVLVLCFMIATIKWKGLFKAKCKFLFFYIKGYYNNNNINTYILFYCLLKYSRFSSHDLSAWPCNPLFSTVVQLLTLSVSLQKHSLRPLGFACCSSNRLRSCLSHLNPAG